jgi:hypothetical protein
VCNTLPTIIAVFFNFHSLSLPIISSDGQSHVKWCHGVLPASLGFSVLSTIFLAYLLQKAPGQKKEGIPKGEGSRRLGGRGREEEGALDGSATGVFDHFIL